MLAVDRLAVASVKSTGCSLGRGLPRFLRRAPWGDKSPKSKQRDQKQKSVEKNKSVADAKAKQVGYSRAPQPTFKGRQ